VSVWHAILILPPGSPVHCHGSGGWWIAYTLAGVGIPVFLSELWDAATSQKTSWTPETSATERGKKNGMGEV